MGSALDALKFIGKNLHGAHGLGRRATYTPPGDGTNATPIKPTVQEETDEQIIATIDFATWRLARCRILACDVATPEREATISGLGAPYDGDWVVHEIRALASGDHSVTIRQQIDSRTTHGDHGGGRAKR